MVVLQEYLFEKVDFEIKQHTTKKHAKLPSRQRVQHSNVMQTDWRVYEFNTAKRSVVSGLFNLL